MDQTGTTPITQSGMTATEAVYRVSSNPAGIGSDASATVPVTSIGTFCDIHAFDYTLPPPPQLGEYIKAKQIITIAVPGRADVVRVNCIDLQYDDVHMTDTTANPSATCQ